MTSSEHVYCVAITFKMTEEVQQWICIKFCIKLEHSSVENIQMIQKAPAMGNWWLATLSQQHAHSCTTFVQFVGKTSNPPRWLKPPTAQIWCPVTSGFSQNSNHLWKGRDFRPWMRFRNIWRSSWRWLGDRVWGPKVPPLKGTEASLSHIQCFLYCVSLIDVSIFHIMWPDTFWTDLVYNASSTKYCGYLQLTCSKSHAIKWAFILFNP